MYADSSGLDSSKSPKKNEEHLTSNKLLFIHFSDLTTLGLNLNSTEYVFLEFISMLFHDNCTHALKTATKVLDVALASVCIAVLATSSLRSPISF